MTIDEKDLYWSNELNKHDHKRFEVEVINRVRTQLEMYMNSKFWDLKPTFQAYVLREGGKRALIDLTFDAINVGLEIDEGHHHRQQKEDKEREADIFDVMAAAGRTDFEICRVDVTSGYKKKMDDINHFIECVRAHIKKHPIFNWDDRPGYVVYKSGSKIKIKDNFEFLTKSDLFNTLLQKPYWGKAKDGQHSIVEETYKKYGLTLTKCSIQNSNPDKELSIKYPNQCFYTRDLNNWNKKTNNRYWYNEYAADLSTLNMYTNETDMNFWHDEVKRDNIKNFFIGKRNKIKFAGQYKMVSVDNVDVTMNYHGTPVKMKHVLRYVKISDELKVA